MLSHFDGKSGWRPVKVLAADNMEAQVRSIAYSSLAGKPVWGTASIEYFALAFLGNQLLKMFYDSVPALHDGFDLGFA